MPRPKRSTIEDGAFRDPLSDYGETKYTDKLHHVLEEHTITHIKHQPYTCVDESTPIEDVLKQMATLDIACVMATRDGRLTGIFSERDVLDRVANLFASVRRDPIATVMTRSPSTIYESETVAKALGLMAIGGFRHVPILDVDDRVIGIVGPRRVNTYLRTCIEESRTT